MNPKRVVVTGSNGFIGSRVMEQFAKKSGIQLFGWAKGSNRVLNVNFDYQDIDLTNSEQFELLYSQTLPDVIIHCAAISQVDKCEQNPQLCFEINTAVTENIVKLIDSSKTQLIYFSTDFVFDGFSEWVLDTDIPAPISVYAKSKRKAELEVEKLRNWAVIRPVLVYGYSESASRGNIFTWVRDSVRNSIPINVVGDQYRTPVYVDDVVKLICSLVDKPTNGYFNIGGSDRISVYDLAVQICEHSGLESAGLNRVSSEDVIGANLRPRNSCFNNTKLVELFNFEPKGVSEGLNEALKRIN